MLETSSRTYQALTSIAADQAKKLLDLAEPNGVPVSGMRL